MKQKKKEFPQKKPERWVELEQEYADLEAFPDEAVEPAPKDDLTLGDQKKRLRQKQFIEAYLASVGNIAASCKLARVSRIQVWRWFKEDWFQAQLNERMFEWELLLRNKMMSLAMSGNVTMLIFLSKFLNPFYDDNFRTKVLMGELGASLYDRHPIPNPEFLPPEIPERFRDAEPNHEPNNDRGETVPAALVHNRGDQ